MSDDVDIFEILRRNPIEGFRRWKADQLAAMQIEAAVHTAKVERAEPATAATTAEGVEWCQFVHRQREAGFEDKICAWEWCGSLGAPREVVEAIPVARLLHHCDLSWKSQNKNWVAWWGTDGKSFFCQPPKTWISDPPAALIRCYARGHGDGTIALVQDLAPTQRTIILFQVWADGEWLTFDVPKRAAARYRRMYEKPRPWRVETYYEVMPKLYGFRIMDGIAVVFDSWVKYAPNGYSTRDKAQEAGELWLQKKHEEAGPCP